MAADRSVNVNINYKVNSVEVEKYERQAKLADQATEKLRGTTQSFANSAASSFKTTGSSIAAMTTDLARLKTQIEVTNQADKKRLTELSAQYKRLKQDLDAATKEYLKMSDAAKKTALSTSELAGQFGQVVTAMKGFIAAGIVKEIIDISLNMARLSGRVEGVQRAFNRAFPNAVKTLEDLRTATHGTVNDFELMQRTIQATNLGVSVEKLPILFEFAATRAQQTGESVDYLVDSIVRGIGRKSILILDNLGLSATRLKEEFNGASLASQSVGDVTEAVGRIAEEELKKMGGYAETAATKVDQLTASVDELKQVFAKKQEQNGNIITDFLNDIAKGWTEVIKGEKELASEEAKRRAANQVDAIIQSENFKNQKGNQTAQIDLILQEIIERKNLLRIREQELEQAQKQRKALVDDLTVINLRKATEGLDEQIASQKESKAVLEESIAILMKYMVSLRQTTEEEEEQLGIIEAKRKQIEMLKEQLEKSTDLNLNAKLKWDIDLAEAELNELLQLYPNKKFPEVKIKAKFDIAKAEAEKQIQEAIDKLKTMNVVLNISPTIRRNDFWDDMEIAFNKFKDDFQMLAVDSTRDLIKASLQEEVDMYDKLIDANREYYDNKMALIQGENTEMTALERYKEELAYKRDRRESELRRKQFQAEKEARKKQAIIDGAAALIKLWVKPGYPEAIPLSFLVAGETAAQLAIMSKTTANFKDGVIDLKGPGTKTSDSIPARLSRGESVMTADETSASKNVLKAIRAKKLNDRVMKDIISGRSGGSATTVFDDSKIIKKLDEVKNAQPDFIKQGSLLMEQRKVSDTYTISRRRKIMGY